MRTIQLGPQEPAASGVALFGSVFRTSFKIPAGATVTFVSIMPPVNYPPTFVRAVLYQSRLLDDVDFEGEKYLYELIPSAFPWGPRDFPVAATWEGRHKVDDNFEYTLEVIIHDGTGLNPQYWKAMVVVEVDE